MEPKWALWWQGLGPQRIQCGVGQLSGIEGSDQIFVHHMFAAPDVYQHGPSRHHGKGASAEDALRFPCQRQQADSDIGLIEEGFKLTATVESGDLCGRPR